MTKAAKNQKQTKDAKKSISHDQNFKRIIRGFFGEFMELFFSHCFNRIDWAIIPSIKRELDREMDSDAIDVPRRIDVLMRVKDKYTDSDFIVQVESQSTADTELPKRMHRYFAKLHARYNMPIYPIVVLSCDDAKPQASKYLVSISELLVLEFRYEILQLNQLDWRDYLNCNNPVGVAFMAKMRIAVEDRPLVKLGCLKALRQLNKLSEAQTALIAEFIDAYLDLDAAE